VKQAIALLRLARGTPIVSDLYQIVLAGAATLATPAPDDCQWLARHAPAYTLYAVCLAPSSEPSSETHPGRPEARTERRESSDSGRSQPNQEMNR